MKKHSHKYSRYRICFQTKSKVWIYKNSRLRNFYKFRRKIVLKTGFFAKNFLITRNMKWTVARRQMVPYFRTRHRFSFFYKTLFFTKQRLKVFYGGLKEYQLRKLFKRSWNVSQNFRTNAFLGILEQRLSVVLFRMRVLPTIYACNQLITHFGVLVNDEKISLINFRIKVGDVVSIPEQQWEMFYDFIEERLENRRWGLDLLLFRKFEILHKIRLIHIRNKRWHILNLRLFKKFNIQKNRILFFKTLLIKFYLYLKQLGTLTIKSQIFLKKFYKIFLKKFYYKIKKIQKFYIKKIRFWIHRNYFRIVYFVFINVYNIQNLFTKYLEFFKQKMFRWIKKFKIGFNPTINETIKFGVNGQNQPEGVVVQKAVALIEKRLKMYVKHRLKITKTVKKPFQYKRYILRLLRRLKFQKRKKRTFRNWCSQIHWYVPNYLEMDFLTLRACFINYPNVSDIHFGFLCSFKKIISFYKERAL